MGLFTSPSRLGDGPKRIVGNLKNQIIMGVVIAATPFFYSKYTVYENDFVGASRARKNIFLNTIEIHY